MTSRIQVKLNSIARYWERAIDFKFLEPVDENIFLHHCILTATVPNLHLYWNTGTVMDNFLLHSYITMRIMML